MNQFDHNSIFSLIAAAWLVVSMGSTVLGDSTGINPATPPSGQTLPAVTVSYNDMNREMTYGISSGTRTLRAAFRTLYWGRLTPDGSLPVSQEMSIRLAQAAHRSPNWDVRKGMPKKGNINGFIKDLANERMIYPELKDLFEQHHKRLTISSVEKVLVFEAGKQAVFDELKQDGSRAKDRLPFDCMVWFSVMEP
jgi:hypothetical protein